MTFDPLEILRVLEANGVEFIVIGGVAANALGSPTGTVDLDICYRRDDDNLDRLAAALGSLNPHLRGVDEDVPFVLDAITLKAGDHFTFTTTLGDIDILGSPAGTSGYDDLIEKAVTVDIDGLTIKVAGLDDLIRMKKAAGRAKDQTELHILTALREEMKGEGG